MAFPRIRRPPTTEVQAWFWRGTAHGWRSCPGRVWRLAGALAGLKAKRSEIAGAIEHHQRALNDLSSTLGRARQFPALHGAFKGEMQRFVLGALRAATEPLTSLEIAIEVVKDRGLDPADKRAAILIRKRVGACLFNLRAKGLARDVATTGIYKGGRRWVRRSEHFVNMHHFAALRSKMQL